MAQNIGDMIEKKIREGMENRRKEKISLYVGCTGNTVETSQSYPYVTDEVLQTINHHIDICDRCKETLKIGSYEEQTY
jgi:hypothetical protein